MKSSSFNETLKSSGKHARKILDTVVGIALYAMVAFVFINAVLRYIFNSGWTLSEELSRWLFVWVTFLGAIVGMVDDSHIGVDLVIGKLGRVPKFIVTMSGKLLMLAAIVIATFGGYKYFMRTVNVPAPASRLPQGLLTVSLLISMGAMLVITLVKIIISTKDFAKSGKENK